jgi:succinoglycan biosynthesis transport protein ExoP
MNLFQFLRILWVRRLLVIAATVSCFVGAYIVTLVVPPVWDSTSRVMLGLLKPDPITGLVVGQLAGPYVATQADLVTDPSVAGRVADQLGWLTDPNLIEQYNRRSKKDVRDYRHWLAQLVIDRTKVKVPDGSNILEIVYSGSTPAEAKVVADALRKAYLDASLEFRRDDATRNADWFAAQAVKDKAALDEVQAAETAYERANGIFMQDSTTDIDTAHLRAIAGEGASTAPVMAPAMASPAAIQLAQLDAEITEDAKTLGPNHPKLIQLRAQRATVAALVAKDDAAVRANAASAAKAGMQAVDNAIATQKSRVIAQSDKLQHLSQLQAEVDRRRDQFNKTSARAAEYRQEAAVADTGLTPLDAAVTPKSPKFPNKLLILPGSIALGLLMGVLVALIAEMLGRRVRGVEDLEAAIDAPVLAVITAPIDSKGRRQAARGRSTKTGLFNRLNTAKAAGA